MMICDHWTFDDPEIVEGFDKHVREQLPWYDLATDLVQHLGWHYICEGGLVYDIGASTGNITSALVPILKNRNGFIISIDKAESMRTAWKAPSELIIADASEYAFENFDFCVCFLTLMFVSPGKRQLLIEKLKRKCKRGGAIVIFDKCQLSPGYLGTVLSRYALRAKLRSGATPEDILKKDLSLAGVQRPLSLNEIDGAIEVFRVGEFAGWVWESV